jgi:small subunit ribosomal protein S20
VRSGLKTAIKSARTAIAEGVPESATTSLRQAERTIRKAASKGVISKKQASRQVSRLAKRAQQPSA